ncbi:hypothetical protein Tco_0039486 [Tanacetum coccineum]
MKSWSERSRSAKAKSYSYHQSLMNSKRRSQSFTWEREDHSEESNRTSSQKHTLEECSIFEPCGQGSSVTVETCNDFSYQILPESREILLTVTKRYDLENK